MNPRDEYTKETGNKFNDAYDVLELWEYTEWLEKKYTDLQTLLNR